MVGLWSVFFVNQSIRTIIKNVQITSLARGAVGLGYNIILINYILFFNIYYL